jgi:hypothetical protein
LVFDSAGAVRRLVGDLDSVLLVTRGIVDVAWIDPTGRAMTRRYGAPTAISIPAQIAHELTAYEDHTECWFIVRDPDAH